jgi:hypothetical protein
MQGGLNEALVNEESSLTRHKDKATENAVEEPDEEPLFVLAEMALGSD